MGAWRKVRGMCPLVPKFGREWAGRELGRGNLGGKEGGPTDGGRGLVGVNKSPLGLGPVWSTPSYVRPLESKIWRAVGGSHLGLCPSGEAQIFSQNYFPPQLDGSQIGAGARVEPRLDLDLGRETGRNVICNVDTYDRPNPDPPKWRVVKKGMMPLTALPPSPSPHSYYSFLIVFANIFHCLCIYIASSFI